MIQPILNYYDMGKDVVAFSSTRKGGCSTGSYASFNINRYCGDREEDILRNREALCRLLDIENERLIMPHQVHLTEILKIDEGFLSLTETARMEALEGYDALMTDCHCVCIGVSTADCIPVLLYDEAHHAVCAVHAGWRGTVKRIVEKAVRTMRATYGSLPEKMVACIGPGISMEAFEVGDEVYDTFVDEGFEMETISCRREKWHINLPECNRQQLLSSGILPQHIHVENTCTFLHPDTYFSARRLGINSGRVFSGIMLHHHTT